VSIKETKTIEPLRKYRKHIDVIKTEGESLTRDEFGRNLFTVRSVTGIKAACGTWEPTTWMLRERFKWKPHKNQSTNAVYRGGITRSSYEIS